MHAVEAASIRRLPHLLLSELKAELRDDMAHLLK